MRAASAESATDLSISGPIPGCHERSAFEASGLSVCVEKDTQGTRRVAELVASFALGEDYGEPRLSNSGGPLMLEL
eukprot:CAMPEP_0180049732 /NCGR_PEP_ID=MMETSP0985-20121206/188_1 /TAXON_ID=483367 /ORGANISM="non described non described, Strain CCMP 2436" /LENGTH=75 /DNA_ID=CAMNT_0021978753 /DNA_START=260 /DNA_END=487 /DNA_ORIENTATION=-